MQQYRFRTLYVSAQKMQIYDFVSSSYSVSNLQTVDFDLRISLQFDVNMLKTRKVVQNNFNTTFQTLYVSVQAIHH